MNVSGVGSPSSITQNLQQAEVRVRSDVQPQSSSAESDTVSISDDAQKKLSSELGATMHKNTQKAESTETKESEQADTRTEIQKQIDELKEQIKELQEKSRALEGSNSEKAEDERTAIDAELNMLLSLMMDLVREQETQKRQEAMYR